MLGSKVSETLSVEEIRDVILASNPTYQAAFLSMFQSSIGTTEFDYWNRNGWDDLAKDLGKDLEVIQIHLPGRMGGRPFHTYIGGDAIEAIRTYLPYRDGAREAFDRLEKRRRNRVQRKGETYVEGEFETAIFYNKFGVPITAEALRKYWGNQIVDLGLVEPAGDGNLRNRYGKNLHEMRSVFYRIWEYSGVPSSFAEYFLDHFVDTSREPGLACMDEDLTRSVYEKALPYLQIMSSDKPFSLFKDENSKRMLDELKRVRDRPKEVEDR